jgi:YD repeat-containing protein
MIITSPLARLALCLCLLSQPALFRANSSSAAGGGGTWKSPAAPGPKAGAVARAPRREGELLVRFRDGVAEGEVEGAVAALGLRRAGHLRGGSGVERVSVPAGRDFEEALSALRSSPLVEFAEPNYLIRADQLAPDDPRFPEQWALRNAGDGQGKAGSDVGAAQAWLTTKGSAETVVAVIDSGVDFTHPDLAANRWTKPAQKGHGHEGDGFAGDTHGWDLVTNSGDVRDEGGHGTAVAGLIAARGNNARGVTGVMWRASLMSLRVLDAEGTGDVAAAVEAIDYAVSRGAHVINASWGTPAESLVLRAAVERAWRRGVPVVCSAGNDGRDLARAPRYPAAYDLPNVIAVAATDSADRLEPSSNTGRSVLVAAPGVGLLTTKAGGGYAEASGTSAAAAVVTGVVGLVKSVRPRLKSAKVSEMLLTGARQVGGLSGRIASGGVVSATAALDLAAALPTGADLEEGEEERPEGKPDAPKQHGPFNLAAPAVAPGVPGRPRRKMPDLDAARGHRPAEPRALRSVPSTLRRCPPHNPRCNEDGDRGPRPAPTPTPASAAHARGGGDLFASLAAHTLLALGNAVVHGGRPPFTLPAFDFYRGNGYAVSDAPTAGLLPAASGVDGADFAAAPAAAPLVQSGGGPAAHWKFDEGSGTTASDSTANANNGALVGAAWAAGKVGAGSLSFDGADDRVAVSNSPSLDAAANDFTISFWANPRSAHQLDPETTSGLGGTSGQRYAWWPRFEAGPDAGAGVSVGTNGVSVYEHSVDYVPATLVYQASISGWTHIAVVYQSRQPRLYVNGTLVRTGLASPRANVRARQPDIGGNAYGYFDGWMDDVRLYGRALSAEEVASLAPPARVNVALAANGGAAAASSTLDANRPALAAINGDRKGQTWGSNPSTGSGWHDATNNAFPDWLEVSFAAAETIDEVSVFSVQDNYAAPQEPTEAMTFTQYGVAAFHLEYWTGTAWAQIPGGSVSGNNKVWRKVTFAPVTTTKIRVVVNSGLAGYSRVTEVEAWRGAQAAQSFVTGKTLGALRNDAPGWTGFRMTTGPEPFSVTSLGRICVGGSTGSRDLRLIRASDNAVVASATVALAGCTNGTFSYAQLAAPVTLAAHTDYLVVSNETGGTYFHNWVGTGLATTSVASVVHGVYTLNGGQTWGPAGGASNSYVPLDFQYAPAPPAPGTGLTGYYFDDPDLTSHRLTRANEAVDFSWGAGAPASGLGADEFSVRWVGTVVPRFSETYTFYTYTDDGVRLWVDGQPVVNKWQDQAPTEWSGQVALVAGRHYDIRMEFYDRFHGAAARLSWSSPSQPKEVVPASRLYGCFKTTEQFVRDFYLGALGRQPGQSELSSGAGRLAAAPDFAGLEAEARALGSALFDSAEYAARGRSDRDFVSDLYRGYLQRGPDQGGWDHWTSQVAAVGRANVRVSFEQSGEFREKARRLCGTAPADPAADNGWGYNFAAAMAEPESRTGATDPYSRNFHWSVPLVSLPGRAGLDLGLSLSYNSLVWTKDGAGVMFDSEGGFPSPGFRLGLPGVQTKFYNPRIQRAGQPARYSYLLVTPAGARVELRQVGTSNIYESADSSYLQLREEGGGQLSLHSTDGTRLDLAPVGGEYRCVKVRDRNGNYITATYDQYGQLSTVTDTLGRVVTFNYDSFRNLVSITQPWRRPDGSGTEPHEYATFGYKPLTLQPSFSNLAVVGAQAGVTIPVVERVGLDDGSYYKFYYTVWGQVWRIAHFAADSVNPDGTPNDKHPLSAVEYNVAGWRDTAAAPQADCPRFTEQRVWAENWNGDEGVEPNQGVGAVADSEQAVTRYPEWSANPTSCRVLLPDRTTVMVETYGAGWQKGLTIQSEVYSHTSPVNSPSDPLPAKPVKKTVPGWAQDDQTLAFAENPRVVETKVFDEHTNSQLTPHGRKTAVEYLTAAESPFRLPKAIREYRADGTTVWRRTEIRYRADSVTDGGAYTNLRVIGLVEESALYGLKPDLSGEETLSKVTYRYDEGGIYLDAARDAANNPVAPTRHDPAYGVSHVQGRGLLTTTKRWNVNPQGLGGPDVESHVGYNIAGAVIFTADAEGHKTKVEYGDRFSDGVNRNTFAYQTATIDPDQSALAAPRKVEMTYDFDRGLVTRTKDLKDLERTFTYDAANRLKEATTLANGAKLKHSYPADMTYVDTYFKVNADKPTEPEAHSWRVFDGAGRVIGTASDHPDVLRTAVRYSAQEVEYDVMGRAFKLSNPTEIDGNWEPAGDDAFDQTANTGGWRHTTQTLDWQGRPLRVTNADGVTFKDFLYKGCGCAGGQILVSRDEVGRRRKTVSDILGRVTTVQDLTLQPDKGDPVEDAAGPGEVYRTATTIYNMRDQAVETRLHAGATESEPTQVRKTVNEYDGHGRLSSSRAPVHSRPTTFEYNDDDTLSKTLTPRELTGESPQDVTTVYEYNNRHLVTRVAHAVPQGLSQSTAPNYVAPTPPVDFEYDAAGNRVAMVDGLGRVDYAYDALSRLSSETRTFSDPDNQSINGVSKTLTYDYNLTGGLEYVQDSAGVRIDYRYDAVGRVIGAAGTGTLYGGVDNYASAMTYRAWGALKGLSYGNGRTLSLRYNERLQMSRYEVPGVVSREFHYRTPGGGVNDNDGRVKFMPDLMLANSKFDRAYSYDSVGRLSKAVTGPEARGGVDTNDRPFRQVYAYDVWDSLTERVGKHWTETPDPFQATLSPATGRNTQWAYDANGNPRQQGALLNGYDAAGRVSTARDTTPRSGFPDGVSVKLGYDGDGQRIKHAEGTTPKYYIRSSALGGGVTAELDASGQFLRGYVYLAGAVLAHQEGGAVTWVHRNPVTGSESQTAASGAEGWKTELDPLGVDQGVYNWYAFNPRPARRSEVMGQRYSEPFNLTLGCEIDGVVASCDMAERLLDSGAGVQCPDNNCGPRSRHVRNPETGELVSYLSLPFLAFASGISGFFESGWLGLSAEEQAEIMLREIRRPGSTTGQIDRANTSSSLMFPFHPLTQEKPALERALGDPNRKPMEAGVPLSPCVKNILYQFFDQKLVDSIRVHNESAAAKSLKALGITSAFAANNHLHFAGTNNQRTQREIVDLVHEVRHSQQYREQSFFLTRYAWNAADQLSRPEILGATLYGWATGGKLAAHDLHPAEKEANKLAQEVGLKMAISYPNNADPCP